MAHNTPNQRSNNNFNLSRSVGETKAMIQEFEKLCKRIDNKEYLDTPNTVWGDMDTLVKHLNSSLTNVLNNLSVFCK